jgi:hypothetical protein
VWLTRLLLALFLIVVETAAVAVEGLRFWDEGKVSGASFILRVTQENQK